MSFLFLFLFLFLVSALVLGFVGVDDWLIASIGAVVVGVPRGWRIHRYYQVAT